MAEHGFKIDEFKAQYQDLARQYLFLVKIDSPYGFIGTDNAKFLVESSSLPESTIDPIEINWQGMVFPVGSTQTYSDWTVTFRLDNAADIRRDFLRWMKKVHDPQSNIHGSPTDYMRDQTVEHLNPKGEIIQTIKLRNAWPTSVGALDLSYDTKEISTFDVTFRYLYHYDTDLDGVSS